MLIWDLEDTPRQIAFQEGYWIDKSGNEIHISNMHNKHLKAVYNWIKKTEMKNWYGEEYYRKLSGKSYLSRSEWIKRGPYNRIYPQIIKELEERGINV